MFGKNPIMKQELGDGNTLRVVQGSPFYTLQGEGPYTGWPAVFIRLHGCNLRCWFCDTEFSNPDDPEWQTVRLARVAYDAARYGFHGRADLVVITGGEPMRQNIYPLCKHLLNQGLHVQIETAGSLWVSGLDELCGPAYGNRFKIVCSPKTPTIHEMIFKHAYCFKYVVGADTQMQGSSILTNTQKEGGAVRALAAPRPGAPVYISPLDEYDEAINAANRKKVGGLALAYGFIAGVQLHKLLDIVEP